MCGADFRCEQLESLLVLINYSNKVFETDMGKTAFEPNSDSSECKRMK